MLIKKQIKFVNQEKCNINTNLSLKVKPIDFIASHQWNMTQRKKNILWDDQFL